jgi:hypothetical protein
MLVQYPRRCENNSWRDIGGEVVILNEEGTQISLLNGTAALIWTLADGTRTVAQLAEAICERFDVQPQRALAHTEEFTVRLREAGLATLSPCCGTGGEE